jgi:quinol monooxygenase YgiN
MIFPTQLLAPAQEALYGVPMVTRGLLVRLEAKHGKETEVEEFLRSALPLVRQEPATTAWFAIRFGRLEYGIFDVFPDDAGRDAHLNGAIAKALMQNADSLLAAPPQIQKLSVLADKLPAAPPADPITKALLLTFKAKAGHEHDVEQFLLNANTLVQEEPKTLAWFAIRLDEGDYGIFDVFPDHGGRFAHLTGHVPRELAKHTLTLLGSVPETHLPEVLAANINV